ncbi:putative serine/threonine protein kinase [Azoarcus olearius]|uniref:bifunctional protein-serine/threonine kinase/phosphatase n=1 Tax=Azoarcus sp. (strain BH72) TaxID=418699 RepID=UPI0008063BFA|nr:bifunctional protein-serine/threonine kinase/phosphatase [Azoarcus olearius]ANQ84457.1 putative serine/threonine protein kinase [Azoarcus olearius]
MNQLSVRIGYTSLTGARVANEDFGGYVTPAGAELMDKGILLAVADGLGGHENGREAAERTVRGLLADYYATPATWSVNSSLERVIQSLNQWVLSQARKYRQTAGMATTLSAMVARGTRYYLAHVGDTRIYRLRGGGLEQLTTDHTWAHPELDSVLSRAVGLDSKLSVDFADGDLMVGDVYALMSDGVWATLGDERIRKILEDETDPEAAAAALAMAATRAGSPDNCTALVMKVDGLPPARLPEIIASGSALPLPPPLKPGQVIDGLTVEEVLHHSLVTLLYRVADAQGRQRVLKTLRNGAGDVENCQALVYEEWLARRVVDSRFPEVIDWPGRSHLYYLMSWHEGATLKARLAAGHRFSPAQVVELGGEILRGVGALHRLAIVHRDIKPDNLHLDAHGRLRILDLGVAASDGHAFNEINNPGTPSYMAPELFAGERANEASDLYAVGVTLYELLARRYPYGEIEPFQKPRFGDPVAVTRYRPDTPDWLEAILLKAVAPTPAERFETAEEFLLALELGAHRPLRTPRRRPLMQRDPALGLKLLAVSSVVLNVFLALLLFAR